MRSTATSMGRDDLVGTMLLSVSTAWLLGVLAVLLVTGETARSAYYVPVALLVAVSVGFFLRGPARARVALLLLVAVPSPWMADSFVGWLARPEAAGGVQLKRAYAERQGRDFDARTPKQVVEDLRRQGFDAWPAVHPSAVMRATARGAHGEPTGATGAELMPLGGIANVTTEYGNEDGSYLIYESDEHGFNNPPGIWQRAQIDVAAIGDSFTHGASVPADRNFVAVVRRRWPATLNLGFGGNGPLTELASLLEYLPRRKPRVVLWVVCEGNDVGEDLARETQSPLLMRYWREARNLQDLETRQPEIDRLLRRFAEDARAAADRPAETGSLRDVAGLTRLRKAVYVAARAPRDQWEVLAAILETAKKVVQGWDGTLYLVYLPTHYAMPDTWLTEWQRGTPEQRRRRVLEIGEALGIPVIDLDTTFRQAGPAVEEYRYPYRGHFTAAGYTAIGEHVVKRLEADGVPGSRADVPIGVEQDTADP